MRFKKWSEITYTVSDFEQTWQKTINTKDLQKNAVRIQSIWKKFNCIQIEYGVEEEHT